VSYIGNLCIYCHVDTTTSWATWVIPTEWRGFLEGDLMNKDFAIAYDRMICLVDGEYQAVMKSDSTSDMAVVKNATKSIAPAGRDSTVGTMVLKRGDYVQFRGGMGTDAYWNLMQISRIKK
jgi:hypothetical protein